ELRALWAVTQLAKAFVEPRATASYVPDRQADPPVTPKPLTFPRQFGGYELLGELGRGGMGVVYKARQQQPDRIVAIKMILRGEMAPTADLQRFQSEAQSAARLDGIANIVGVHEVDQVDGQPYFSMEFVEGNTLAKRLLQGPISQREAAQCLATI